MTKCDVEASETMWRFTIEDLTRIYEEIVEEGNPLIEYGDFRKAVRHQLSNLTEEQIKAMSASDYHDLFKNAGIESPEKIIENLEYNAMTREML